MKWRFAGGSRRRPTHQSRGRSRMLRRTHVCAWQLFVRGPSADHPADFPAELARAREETERAEDRRPRESAPFRREGRVRSGGLEDVKRALPADAALVSLIQYEAGIYSRPAGRRRFAHTRLV